MSNQLLDSLESKVFSAVDTIDSLRSEINVLKEERRTLEDRLRKLLGRIEGLDGGALTSRPDIRAEAPGSITGPAFKPNIEPFKKTGSDL